MGDFQTILAVVLMMGLFVLAQFALWRRYAEYDDPAAAARHQRVAAAGLAGSVFTSVAVHADVEIAILGGAAALALCFWFEFAPGRERR